MKYFLFSVYGGLIILIVAFYTLALRDYHHPHPCYESRTQDQYLACMTRNLPAGCDEACMVRRNFQ